jgi:signal transduction histidine kinase
MAHEDPRDLIHATSGRGYAQRVSLALPAWLGRPSTRTVDAGVVALVGLIVVGSALASGADQDRVLLGLVFGVAAVVPLVWRRRWPFAALAAVLAVAVASPVDAQFALPIAVLLYTIGSTRSWEATFAAAASVVATGLGYRLAGGNLTTGDLVSTGLLCAVSGGVGLYVGSRRASFEALRERAARLQRERERLAERAVAEERLRIAQELHDVVAHNVSLIVVQAQALGATVPDERVAAATDGIADLGRQAMAEMHRTLKLLRAGDDDAAAGREPQPGLADLDGLLARSRAAGLAVQLAIEGEPRPLAQGIDLSAYRILQEALTNVVKHAGRVEATVTLGYRVDALELTVTDAGDGRATATGPGGHGLVGMRERAALFGGTLTAAPRNGHGFEVHAVLPYGRRGAS